MESIYPGSTSSSVLLSNKETQMTQMKETVFFSMYFSANIQYILHISGKTIRNMFGFFFFNLQVCYEFLLPLFVQETNIAPFTASSHRVYIVFHAQYATLPSGFRLTWSS